MKKLLAHQEKIIVLLLISLIIVCTPQILSAKSGLSDISKIPLHFEDEKRLIICIAEGYACTNTEISPNTGKNRALEAAKRFALRKCSDLIKERLIKAGNDFDFELIPFRPGEFVKIIDQHETDSPFHGTGAAYGIRIKGEIQYRITGETDKQKLISNPNLPLTVRVWSDKQTYKEGDKVVFYIRGNRDFFTSIVDIAPGGEIIQLLPNSFRESDFFKGGITYKFPDPEMGDEFDMETSPPFGKENVLIFGANIPIGRIPFKEYVGQFGLVNGKEEDVKNYARQIDLKKTGTFFWADFFESRWLIITSEK